MPRRRKNNPGQRSLAISNLNYDDNAKAKIEISADYVPQIVDTGKWRDWHALWLPFISVF
jgi:hypothetical protein